MTKMTDTEAEKLQAKLDAHRAAQAKDARDAENQKRADRLAISQPALDDLLDKGLVEGIDKLRARVAGMTDVQAVDLRRLIDNVTSCYDAAVTIAQRRVDDSQPVPEIDVAAP